MSNFNFTLSSGFLRYVGTRCMCVPALALLIGLRVGRDLHAQARGRAGGPGAARTARAAAPKDFTGTGFRS